MLGICDTCIHLRDRHQKEEYRQITPLRYIMIPEETSYYCRVTMRNIVKPRKICGDHASVHQRKLNGGKRKMALNGLLGGIKPAVLASDLPDEIVATVLSMEKGVKAGQFAGAPLIKVSLRTDDDVEFTTSFRVPKSWTGRGQLDKLIGHLDTLGVIETTKQRGVIKEVKTPLESIVGMTFKWERMELSGGMKGNPRHYPVEIIEK